MKFKVGDEVVIVDISQHFFTLGDVVKIASINKKFYVCEYNDLKQYIKEDQIMLNTEASKILYSNKGELYE